MLLWYNTMAAIPGVRNSSDFAPIPLIVYRYENRLIDESAALKYT